MTLRDAGRERQVDSDPLGRCYLGISRSVKNVLALFGTFGSLAGRAGKYIRMNAGYDFRYCCVFFLESLEASFLANIFIRVVWVMVGIVDHYIVQSPTLDAGECESRCYGGLFNLDKTHLFHLVE